MDGEAAGESATAFLFSGLDVGAVALSFLAGRAFAFSTLCRGEPALAVALATFSVESVDITLGGRPRLLLGLGDDLVVFFPAGDFLDGLSVAILPLLAAGDALAA